jgi:predicted GNAT family acetyltransferase
MRFQTDKDRIYLSGDDGETLAEVAFYQIKPGVVNIARTYVDASLRGRGVAGELMRAAAAELTARGQKAVATCSYAERWFAEHPDAYAPLRPE